MPYKPPVKFDAPWDSVPQCWLDVETTGTNHTTDRVVEIAIARFESGKCVSTLSSLIYPGRTIPEEATAIHGITDEMVTNAPPLAAFFARHDVTELMSGTQLGGYNATFDRLFVMHAAHHDHSWPWLDTMTLVRSIDRFVSGKGAKKLAPSCERHGVKLVTAHSSVDDARAAGELCHVLVPKQFDWNEAPKLGRLLWWMRQEANDEWVRFHEWLAKQPDEVTT